MLAEREREWNGLRTELNGELGRVKGELETSHTQCTLLRETSEKVCVFVCVCAPVITL